MSYPLDKARIYNPGFFVSGTELFARLPDFLPGTGEVVSLSTENFPRTIDVREREIFLLSYSQAFGRCLSIYGKKPVIVCLSLHTPKGR
jgi:hypothetical protein